MPAYPSRNAERRRYDSNENAHINEETDLAEVDPDGRFSGIVEAPPADESWHPAALALYESIRTSGQSYFYEPSDWQVLWVTCESLSRDLKPRPLGLTETGEVKWARLPLNGASLNAYLKAFGDLGMVEGQRRKMRMELERKRPDAVDEVEGETPDQRRRRLLKLA